MRSHRLGGLEWHGPCCWRTCLPDWRKSRASWCSRLREMTPRPRAREKSAGKEPAGTAGVLCAGTARATLPYHGLSVPLSLPLAFMCLQIEGRNQ